MLRPSKTSWILPVGCRVQDGHPSQPNCLQMSSLYLPSWRFSRLLVKMQSFHGRVQAVLQILYDFWVSSCSSTLQSTVNGCIHTVRRHPLFQFHQVLHHLQMSIFSSPSQRKGAICIG